MFRSLPSFGGLLVAASVLLAACMPASSPAPTTALKPAAPAAAPAPAAAEVAQPAPAPAAKPAGPPEKVRLQLKWVPQAQFAGYYVAQDKGFYRDENLEVTILPGGPDIVPEQQVANGQADFGI